MMLALFIMACRSYFGPDQDNTAIFGFGPPMVFGVGALLLGVVLMVLARVGLPHFFRRKPEVVDPAFVGVH